MEKWRFKRVLRKRYGRQIWIVRKRNGKEGYLKFPLATNQKAYAILVANEIIAASLAESVGLYVARSGEAAVKGPQKRKKRGVVSEKKKAQKVITWRNAYPKISHELEKHVEQLDLLAQIVVFDAWILNLDRTSRNLMLYRNKADEPYKWYLIDHGLALFGTPENWKRKWAKKPLTDAKSYEHTLHPKKAKTPVSQRVPSGFIRLVLNHRPSLDNMIRTITSLPVQEIEKAIEKVPKGYLSHAERAFVTNMLLTRQKELPTLVSELLDKFSHKKRKKLGSTV